MSWIEIGALVLMLFLALKFLVKPLFKLIAIAVLVLVAIFLLKGF